MRRQREHKAKIYGYIEYYRAKRLTNLFYFLFSVWLTFFLFLPCVILLLTAVLFIIRMGKERDRDIWIMIISILLNYRPLVVYRIKTFDHHQPDKQAGWQAKCCFVCWHLCFALLCLLSRFCFYYFHNIKCIEII